MLGQNRWSNLSVKLLGQIASRNHGSNSWVKLTDQILWSNAANPWPAAGQPRRTHGHAHGQPENAQGWAGKGQRKTPRCDAWGLVGWR